MYLGIDPGKAGGLAVIGDRVTIAYSMPATDHDLVETLRSIQEGGSIRMAALERAQSMPGQGVVSAFTYGAGWGVLRGVLAALRVPYELVAPGTWQRALGCLSGGDKNVTKRKAQQLYPDLKITHKTADALLIAEWCRRQHHED